MCGAGQGCSQLLGLPSALFDFVVLPHDMLPKHALLIVPVWPGNASTYLVENHQICGGCVLGIFSQKLGL